MSNEKLMRNDYYVDYGWTKELCDKLKSIYSKGDDNVVFMGFHSVIYGKDWTNFAVPVWYQPIPAKYHSNYFTFIRNLKNSNVFIMDGSSAFSVPFEGVVADDGEIIYSRYRHDYVLSEDKSVSIDGGREYTKGSLVDPSRRVIITVQDQHFKIETT